MRDRAEDAIAFLKNNLPATAAAFRDPRKNKIPARDGLSCDSNRYLWGYKAGILFSGKSLTVGNTVLPAIAKILGF